MEATKLPRGKKGTHFNDKENADARFQELVSGSMRLGWFGSHDGVKTAPYFYQRPGSRNALADLQATRSPASSKIRENPKKEDLEHSFFVALNQNKKLEASLALISSKNAKLNSELSEIADKNRKNREENDRLNMNLEIENELLKETVLSHQRLQSAISRQKQQTVGAAEGLAVLEAELAALEDRIRKAELECLEQADEEDQLALQLQTKSVQEKNLQDKISDLELFIASQDTILANLETESERVHSEIERRRQKNISLKSRRIEATSLYFQKMRDLEELRSSRAQGQAENAHIIGKIRMLELENDQMIQKLAEMQGELAEPSLNSSRSRVGMTDRPLPHTQLSGRNSMEHFSD